MMSSGRGTHTWRSCTTYSRAAAKQCVHQGNGPIKNGHGSHRRTTCRMDRTLRKLTDSERRWRTSTLVTTRAVSICDIASTLSDAQRGVAGLNASKVIPVLGPALSLSTVLFIVRIGERLLVYHGKAS